MEIATADGGIVGVGLARNLHRRDLACRAHEALPEVKKLGGGITEHKI